MVRWQVYLYDMHHSLLGYYATKEIDPVMEREMRATLANDIFNQTLVFYLADHGLHFGPHLGTISVLTL